MVKFCRLCLKIICWWNRQNTNSFLYALHETYMALTSSTISHIVPNQLVSQLHHNCQCFLLWHFVCKQVFPCKLRDLVGTLTCRERNCSLDIFRRRFVALGNRWVAREDRRISQDQRTRDIFCLSLHCLVRTDIRRCRAAPAIYWDYLRVDLSNEKFQ